MNDIYWRKETREKENRNKTKLWMIFSFAFYIIYCVMMITDALYYDGDIYMTLFALFVASPLPVIPMIVYIKRMSTGKIPMYIAVAASIAFLGFGTYMKVLDYHFFVLFITIGIVMVMKDYKLLLKTTLIISAVNAVFIAGLMPRLEWLNNFRFTMQFIFFLFGALFILILTRNVDSKETHSNRALAAFTALLGSTPNLMAITDSSRRVYYLSEPFLKFIGYPRREYTVGQPLIDLIFDWKLKMVFADMLDAEGFLETEIDLDIDGEQRHFKFTTDKMTGGFEGIFVDIADITPIVQGRRAAEEANRSKSSFLATMSHEIRTPLNAIIGITQIQMQSGNLPAEYASSLEKVNTAGNSLLGIINDILDMSKIEAGNLQLYEEKYDVARLINDAVQLNIVRIGSKPIEIKLDINADIPSQLHGDELRLKQILNNLLSNAVKYTGKGEVKLTVRATEPFGQFDDEIYLTFTVSDTGQGMKPEDMEKLFSEGYLRFNASANRTTEGTGLGLNITKQLVEMMDGTITAESDYGQGSTFSAKVKQRTVKAPPIGEKTASSLRSLTYRDGGYVERRKTVRNPMPYGKVLVVDDSSSNLFVAKGLLSPYKLKIETVESGFDAIERIEKGMKYDIIFMDHMMPRMDGIETTKKLREMGYHEPVVALTANALAGNETMFAQNGFDGYIPKPIDMRRLDGVLNKFIRDRHPEEAEFYRAETIAHPAADNISVQLKSVFSREAIRAAETLRGALKGGDVKTLTITVHAMKSALANVGEKDLSALAAKLEHAGNEGDREFIDANTEEFIDRLKTLVNKLETETGKLKPEKKAGEDTAEDKAFLKEQLDTICDACRNYDDAPAYAALDKLADKEWSRETEDKLEGIRNALFLDSDFEKALELAGE